MPSASLSLLPSFYNSPTIVERFKPGFVYGRRSRHESGSTSFVPPHDLDLAPAPASTTLHRSTRPSQPPDWPWNMSVGKMQCKQNFKHLRRITLEILFIAPTVKPIGSKWIFSVKFRFDDSLDRYKARLVALENKHEYEIDYEETFAHVAKMTTIQTILAIAAS
ncbi:uncharacterized protein LOC121237998 [Juglans microcarpa x Juglans regia]|uniref:uncharacterized protein LOC121237998 n=1 Tax=Juglans microcarpa x Juglans regia TaxID=2249226 RepID=UPI001B7DE2CD|nr:uncharacterized protein LOC121237998 [Juglans microcarpa x Juglans regia]